MTENTTRDIAALLRERVVPPGGSRHGLVIGIEQYRDKRLNLRCAAADAKAIFNLMIDPDCGMFPKDNVRLLLNEEATRDGIWKALSALRRIAGEDDTVWVYYAGHAAPEESDLYWVTHDADVDDLYGTGLSNDQISRVLGDICARRQLVLLDCCHAAATAVQKNPTRDVLTADEVFSCYKGHGRITLSSSDGKEKSVELGDVGHGAFTYFLAQGLRGEADKDGDGVVTADELWHYLRSKVVEASRKAGNSQTPVLLGEMRHDFALSLNPLEFGRRRSMAEAIRNLVGVNADQLTTEEGRMCLDLLRRKPSNDAERDLVAEFSSLLEGRLQISTLRRLIDDVRETAPSVKTAAADTPKIIPPPGNAANSGATAAAAAAAKTVKARRAMKAVKAFLGSLTNAFRLAHDENNVTLGIFILAAAAAMTFLAHWFAHWEEASDKFAMNNINKMAQEVIVVPSDRILAENDGRLVFVSGPVNIVGSLKDPTFGVSVKALELMRTAKMFQWTYEWRGPTRSRYREYKKKWKDQLVDSSDFEDGRRNPQFPFYSKSWKTNDLMVGAFPLSEGLTERFRKEHRSGLNNFSVRALPSMPAFKGLPPVQVHDGMVFFSEVPANPQVGDVRISYQIRKAPVRASVMANQSNGHLTPQTSHGYARVWDEVLDLDAAVTQLKLKYSTNPLIIYYFCFMLSFVFPFGCNKLFREKAVGTLTGFAFAILVNIISWQVTGALWE